MMSKTKRAGTHGLSCWLALTLGAATHAHAQQTSADSGSTQPASSSSQATRKSQPSQSSTPAPHRPAKSAAQENPFPSDVSEKAAQQQDQPSDAPAAPDAQSTQKPGDAAKDNPFPEDVSKGAAAAAKGSGSSGGSSSSNSAGSNDWSSSNPGEDADPNADLPRDNGRRKLKKPSDSDIESGSLAGQGRAQDDVKVGRYYLQTEDYQGAYGRFSEAARLDPTSLGAIYGLAAAAAGLHRTDEALTNYKLYLEIAPDGSDAKSARKAIRELSK